FGAFLPFFRNHSAIGTRRQEPWAFDEKVEELVKKAIDLRYSLLPYFYSIHRQSANGETTMIRPLALAWPQDRETYYADDQFMMGSAIMVAPVYQRNSEGRHVYLPEGEWLDLNSKSIIEGGHIWVNAPLDSIPHFQRRDTLIVTTTTTAQYAESGSWGDLRITGFVEERAEFNLYEDDGFTYAYETGEYSIKKLVVTNTHDGIKIEVSPQRGTFICKERVLSFEIYNESGLHEAKLSDSAAGCEVLIEES
ncbi:MAG: DUF5110 domain-containing protein, partial [Kosmotogaceae bacterium]|nr:DUF5110 domain-containing protein [Kosmotogaceae bacterium]